ncbi:MULTISPECIES: Flp family type IVb pilin [Nocardioides]|uniref:Flp family type IVb pilin n=1 Tax=Nocardioides TaxID=1839 RepID=UPI0004126967|nr:MULTISPECIES: Flp family type IVb pilin [Nocardioides]
MIQFLSLMLNARRDDEKGATAVEYGLMVALIAAAIILTVGLLGDELVKLFTEVTTGMQGR